MARTWWDRDAKGRFERTTGAGGKGKGKKSSGGLRLNWRKERDRKYGLRATEHRWRPALHTDFTVVRLHEVAGGRMPPGQKRAVGWQVKGFSRQ